MLPKNKLRDRRLERLKIFCGPRIGVYDGNILKRWDDGTLKGPTPAQQKQWEAGILPEAQKQMRVKEKERQRALFRVRAHQGLPL